METWGDLIVRRKGLQVTEVIAEMITLTASAPHSIAQNAIEWGTI
jgi:hypothetical protein